LHSIATYLPHIRKVSLMKQYNLTEACTLLGIDRSTLTRRIKRQHIKLSKLEKDHRNSYISDADIERLRSIYDADDNHSTNENDVQHKHKKSTANKSYISEEYIQRIQDLEKRVKTLETLLDSLGLKSDGLIQSDDESYLPSPVRRSFNRFTTPKIKTQSTRPMLPDGWIAVKTFAIKHGISPNTLRYQLNKAIERGKPLHHSGEWTNGHTVITGALDPEQQETALSLFEKYLSSERQENKEHE
jgi:hypothetical protein